MTRIFYFRKKKFEVRGLPAGRQGQSAKQRLAHGKIVFLRTSNFALGTFCGYTHPPIPMDATLEIKARLPIEELVSKYVSLQKKGRNLVAVCPFHNDKHPSLLVSPDKGIAYCFACQKGGDIFTFYQQIE